MDQPLSKFVTNYMKPSTPCQKCNQSKQTFKKNLKNIKITNIQNPLTPLTPLVHFNGISCSPVKAKYPNGNNYLILISTHDTTNIKKNQIAFVASTNVHKTQLQPNEVVIKNYGENNGILDALVNANVIQLTNKTIKKGLVKCPIAIILI